jgi:hypothetical protein
MLLLGLWLILTGLIPLLKLQFSGHEQVMQIFAIVAGALLLTSR